MQLRHSYLWTIYWQVLYYRVLYMQICYFKPKTFVSSKTSGNRNVLSSLSSNFISFNIALLTLEFLMRNTGFRRNSYGSWSACNWDSETGFFKNNFLQLEVLFFTRTFSLRRSKLWVRASNRVQAQLHWYRNLGYLHLPSSLWKHNPQSQNLQFSSLHQQIINEILTAFSVVNYLHK